CFRTLRRRIYDPCPFHRRSASWQTRRLAYRTPQGDSRYQGAEAGCLEYVPTYDAETDIGNQVRLGLDRVIVIEKWETVAHLKGHMVAPHMQAYRPKVKDFVKSTELRGVSPA